MNPSTGASPVVLAYAQSLFNVARKQGVVRQLLEDCKTIRAIFRQTPMLGRFLDGPQISREQKRKLIDDVFGKKLHPLMLNMFRVTIDRDRAGELADIFEEFQNVSERAEGIHPARVITARELGFQEKLKLKTALEKFAGCHLRINYDIQPAIKGGIIFKFQDSLVDGSVRSNLEKLGRKLRGGTALTYNPVV